MVIDHTLLRCLFIDCHYDILNRKLKFNPLSPQGHERERSRFLDGTVGAVTSSCGLMVIQRSSKGSLTCNDSGILRLQGWRFKLVKSWLPILAA